MSPLLGLLLMSADVESPGGIPPPGEPNPGPVVLQQPPGLGTRPVLPVVPRPDQLVDSRKLPLQCLDGSMCRIDVLGIDNPAALIDATPIALQGSENAIIRQIRCSTSGPTLGADRRQAPTV
jgi:hypothetical protein